MKIAYQISTFLVTGLGIVHTVMTPVFYPEFSPDTAWFAGTGLALIFLGFLNFYALLVQKSVILNFCIVANVLGSILGVLIIIVLPEPQAFVALIAFLGIFISSVVNRIQVVNHQVSS